MHTGDSPSGKAPGSGSPIGGLFAWLVIRIEHPSEAFGVKIACGNLQGDVTDELCSSARLAGSRNVTESSTSLKHNQHRTPLLEFF
ncbi:hypothetical protein IPP92_00005 [Candidatus Saccharibacteria bacterium]|nr:MAG: hypothetical protein IPP92_00005 [Candidatus Saccharibacteria bacterium]